MSIREDPYLALPPGIRLRDNGVDVGQITSLNVIGAAASAVVNTGTLNIAPAPVVAISIQDDGVDEGDVNTLNVVGPELSVGVAGSVASLTWTRITPSYAALQSVGLQEALFLTASAWTPIWKTDGVVLQLSNFIQTPANSMTLQCTNPVPRLYRINYSCCISLPSASVQYITGVRKALSGSPPFTITRSTTDSVVTAWQQVTGSTLFSLVNGDYVQIVVLSGASLSWTLGECFLNVVEI